MLSHSVMSDSVTPWTAAHQASLSITIFHNLLKLMSFESVMPSTRLILCPPFLLLPSILPSILVFSNESALLNKWPKYWSFSLNSSPSSEYSGLISFWIDWFGLLAAEGTLSLVWHQSLKPSVLWCSTFFMLQLLHPYMTTKKNIALTIRNWEVNRQEGQGSPNRGNRLKMSDIFSLSLRQQEETNKCYIFPPSLYKFKKKFLLKFYVAITTPGSTWT